MSTFKNFNKAKVYESSDFLPATSALKSQKPIAISQVESSHFSSILQFFKFLELKSHVKGMETLLERFQPNFVPAF